GAGGGRVRFSRNRRPSREIPAPLPRHSSLELAVVGFTKPPEGEEIAAFVVTSTDLTEAALIAHCRARLDPDKRPRRFVFVPNLTRNANCKVLCGELRSRLERSD